MNTPGAEAPPPAAARRTGRWRYAVLLAAALLIGLPAQAQESPEEVGLERVAGGLTAPVTLAQPPDGSGRLFVVEQVGRIQIVRPDGTMPDEPFLDIQDRLVTLNSGYDERGLLGLAFHPDYADNGRFFVYYSAPLRDEAPDDYDHTSHISEFVVSGEDANQADDTSERILMVVDQPQGNHNAGTLTFGPTDGYLYISLGDGGGAHDTGVGHVDDWYATNTGGNGQDITDNLLGSILRIDVDGTDEGLEYAVPADNPFAETDGLDEIFAYGFRNPYRMSFDMGGDNGLLAGDAGQNLWEEVSLVEAGGNYGWNVKEGTHCFNTDNPDVERTDCPDAVGAGHPREGDPLIDPVIEYPNAGQANGVGLVVVGGYVYRGNSIPEFEGRYLFGDWSSDFEAPEGQLFIATPGDTGLWEFETLRIANPDHADGTLGYFVLGFGQDLTGEVYALVSESPNPTPETGEVYLLVPPGEVTAVEPGSEQPSAFALEQNYPNPFNPTTQLRFALSESGPVTLRVYDTLGREVATLVEGVMPAGTHVVTWDGSDEAGGRVSSGSYLYRLEAADGTSRSRVMTLLK